MRILFQGDSITDAARSNECGCKHAMGQGYALLAAARLAAKYPGEIEYLNFGVSGDRCVDIYARIRRDCWNHKPDVVSFLFGVNDIGHEYAAQNGVDHDRAVRVSRMLIEDTLAALPGVQIMLLEPFIIKGTATERNWEEYDRQIRARAAATKQLAEEYGLIFVPLQEKLDEVCRLCEPTYWVWDGVHPTIAGHQLMADAWVEAFEREIMK